MMMPRFRKSDAIEFPGMSMSLVVGGRGGRNSYQSMTHPRLSLAVCVCVCARTRVCVSLASNRSTLTTLGGALQMKQQFNEMTGRTHTDEETGLTIPSVKYTKPPMQQRVRNCATPRCTCRVRVHVRVSFLSLFSSPSSPHISSSGADSILGRHSETLLLAPLPRACPQVGRTVERRLRCVPGTQTHHTSLGVLYELVC